MLTVCIDNGFQFFEELQCFHFSQRKANVTRCDGYKGDELHYGIHKIGHAVNMRKNEFHGDAQKSI